MAFSGSGSVRDVARRCPMIVAIMVVLFAVFLPLPLLAGVSVFPTEVFVNSPNRSAAIVLTNKSDRPEEISISFTYEYPVSFDSGQIRFSTQEDVSADDPTAVPWVRAIPQQLILQPQEAQTVRIYGTPPATARNGEFWARIVFTSKGKKVARPAGTTSESKLNMNLVTATSVPFHYRIGTLGSGVLLKDAKATAEAGVLRLQLNLERRGNASFWGRASCRLVDLRGRQVASTEFRIVVYKDFVYANTMDVSSVPPGDYTLELLLDNKHPSMNARNRVSSDPVRRSISVTIP